MSGLYVLYQQQEDDARDLPLGVGVAPSAQKAVDNVKAARAQAGIFGAATFRAVPFYEAPFEDAVRAALDCLLNVIGQAALAGDAARRTQPGRRT